MFIICCFQTSWNNPSVPLMPVVPLFCLISNNFLSQLEAVNLCLPKIFIFFDPSGETQLMYHLLIPDCFSSGLSFLSFLSHSLSLTPSPPLSKTISSNIDRAFRKYIKYLSIISIQLHIRREKVMAAYGMPQKDFSNFSFVIRPFGFNFKLTAVKFVLFIKLVD